MKENKERPAPGGSLGLGTKLTLGFVGLLAILLAVGVESISLLTELGGSIDVILRENYKSVVACERMKEALERMDSGAFFALAGEVEKGRELMTQNRPRFEESLQTELGNITLAGEGERAERLRQLFASYMPVLERILDPQVPPAEKHALYFESLLPVFQQIKSTAGEILQMNQQSMVEANDRARALAASASRRMALLLIAGTAFAGLCVLFLSRAILVPLERLTLAAKQIEGGDLDEEVALFSTGRRVEEEHRQQLRLEPVPPGDLIDAAVQNAADLSQEKQVELAAEVDPEVPRVLADREQTGRLLPALLRNAVVHTPAGGSVTVRAEPWEGRIRFTVLDMGRGVPPAHRGLIFEPFYQVPGTEDLGGIGLGLTMARDIVQAHGGEIHCEGEEGRGATFWFTLPAAME